MGSDAGHAQQLTRAVQTAWLRGEPRVSFTYRDLFDGETIGRIQSGLQVTVVMRAWVYPETGREPVGFVARSCRIAYDLWDENYRVEVLDPAGLRNVALGSLEGVLAQCGTAGALPVRMFRPPRQAERLRVSATAEVDPVTPDMVARIQRWVANPGETAADGHGGFFDAFVALFVSPNVTDAARTIRIESTPIVAP